MSLTPQLTLAQWQTYLPFLYKFLFEHNKLSFIQTIGAKFYKEPSHQNPLIVSFVIAGLDTLQHTNQNYSYQVTERLVRAYDLVLAGPLESDQSQLPKVSQSQKLLSQIKLPELKEKNKLYYDKDITCFEELIVTKKRSIEYETSVTFYALALKNQSIRVLNASILTGRPAPKRSSFLGDRSPFLAKNANSSNLSGGNYCEAAIIPLQKEVSTIKFNPHDMLLLCGCTDGTVVMVNLNYHVLGQGDSILNGYRFFTHHKRAIKDLSWMTYSYDEKQSFVSLADDGFVVWNKQTPALPVYQITQITRTPTSLIQVQPDQFIISGRDCSLKFFDIHKGYSYTYHQNTQLITKLYNLTGEIQYSTKSKKDNIDQSLRFISCEHTGKIIVWQGEKEFEHCCHQGKISAVDFVPEYGGLYLAIEKDGARLSLFSPVLMTYCLQESD